jgi:hypothetical protein
MFTINPFAELTASIPASAMQAYIIGRRKSFNSYSNRY